MRLSAHFSEEEFRCRCGCGQVRINPQLVAKLERLREKVGQPIHISSGYRCPAHNKAKKGAKFSQHMKGTAADITVRGMTALELKPLAEKVFGYKSGIGTYPQFPKMLHVDVRSWHARW